MPHPIPASQSRRLSDSAFFALSVLLFAAATIYLVGKTIAMSGSTGYDFKYLWLAGKIWVGGVSPYGPSYHETGLVLIREGHEPDLWIYPPSWWLACVAFAKFDLPTAHSYWNIANIVMAFFASVLLVRAYLAAMPGRSLVVPFLGDLLRYPWALVFVHFFVVAVSEATVTVLAAGQTSILVYLGIAVLLYGMVRENRALAVIGLTIIFLKPQIGLIFAVVFLFSGRNLRQLVWLAAACSLGLSVPALFVDPAAILAFVRNAMAYDGMGIANLPQTMTGIRLLIWELLRVDIGSIAAVFITIALALCTVRWQRIRYAHPGVQAWLKVTVIVALITAVAPLHYYDFVFAAVLPFVLLSARRVPLLAGLTGGALILRADQLGTLTGLYDPKVAIFEGSILSTVGSFLICVAIYSAVRRIGDTTETGSSMTSSGTTATREPTM